MRTTVILIATFVVGCSKPDEEPFTCTCSNGTETRLSIFSRATELVTNGEWVDNNDGPSTGGCTEPGRSDVHKANTIEILETRCK